MSPRDAAEEPYRAVHAPFPEHVPPPPEQLPEPFPVRVGACGPAQLGQMPACMVEVHYLHCAPEALVRHLPYPVRPVGREHRRLRPVVAAPRRLVAGRLPEIGPVRELDDAGRRAGDALHLALGVRPLQEHRPDLDLPLPRRPAVPALDADKILLAQGEPGHVRLQVDHVVFRRILRAGCRPFALPVRDGGHEPVEPAPRHDPPRRRKPV